MECSLVLEAAGIAWHIEREAHDYVLLVSSGDTARARGELGAYVRENRGDGGHEQAIPHFRGGWVGVYAYTAVLLLVDVLEDRGAFGMDWAGVGRVQSDVMRQGQWWRSVTALTLHVDAAHLMGNVVVGGLFGLFAGQLLGFGSAWLSILVAGAAGNAINAWIRNTPHTSVGASTAVFAALGIVAAYARARRRDVSLSALGRWAPLVSGIVLLGFLGTGGVRSDVGAHIAGFCCGVALGAYHGRKAGGASLSGREQFLLGIIALALLVVSWSLAFATGGA